MTRDEKKKAEKKILILSLGSLVLLGVFLVFCFISGQIQSLVFPVGASIFLAVYWVIADILPVFWAKIFEEKNEMQKQAYYMYALIDFIGLAGLVYFVADLESTMGAIIYAASIFLKRNFKDKFEGKEENESQEPQSEDTTTDIREIQEDMQEQIPEEQKNRDE